MTSRRVFYESFFSFCTQRVKCKLGHGLCRLLLALRRSGCGSTSHTLLQTQLLVRGCPAYRTFMEVEGLFSAIPPWAGGPARLCYWLLCCAAKTQVSPDACIYEYVDRFAFGLGSSHVPLPKSGRRMCSWPSFTASRSSKAAVVEQKLRGRGGIGLGAGCCWMLSASDPPNARVRHCIPGRVPNHLSCCVVIVLYGKLVRVLWSTCCKGN